MIADIASTNFIPEAAEIRQMKQAAAKRPAAARSKIGAEQSKLREKISAALSLGDGWDGPGSLAPRMDIAYRVESLVLSALAGVQNPHLPFIVPMADGGLQVEWHQNGADLEVAFFGSGEISGLFEDRVAGGEIESEGTEALDLLLRYAQRVAQKADNAVDASDAPRRPAFSIAA